MTAMPGLLTFLFLLLTFYPGLGLADYIEPGAVKVKTVSHKPDQLPEPELVA